MIVGPTMEMPSGLMGAGAFTRAISSAAIAWRMGPAPWPPYSRGHMMPMRPAS